MQIRIDGRSGETSAQGSAQGSAQVTPFFDELALAAGPTRAVVVDEYGLLGVVDYDHERGAALDAVPAEGWVS